MKHIKISQIIVNSANGAIKNQKPDGSFTSDKNGPWNIKETPIRVTAHWVILLIKAYDLTKNDKYKNPIEKGIHYIISQKARPNNYAFKCCESNNEFQECNGLIGQAWAIEAIIYYSEYFNEKKYYKFLSKFISNFSFNKTLKLWNVLSVKGKNLNVHHTLNQQIWFTVMAYKIGILTNDINLIANCECFFENLNKSIKFRNHYIDMLINERIFLRYPKSYLKLCFQRIHNKHNINIQSEGYLSFTLYGLAILHTINPNLNIWKDMNIKKFISQSISYIDKNLYNNTNKNKYAFSYNPTGFEVAFVKSTFKDYIQIKNININHWLKKQIKQHYDFNKGIMSKNTDDPIVLSARLYEIVRINNKYMRTTI